MRAAFIRQRRHLRRGRIVDLGWLTPNNRQGAAGSCAQSSRIFANVRGDGGAKRSDPTGSTLPALVSAPGTDPDTVRFI